VSLRPGVVVLPCVLAGTALGILAVDPSGGPRSAEQLALLALAAAATVVVGSLLLGGRWALTCVAAGAVAGGVLLGTVRGAAVALPTGPDAVTALIGAEWRIGGTVTDDPRPRADRIQVVLESVAAGPVARSSGGSGGSARVPLRGRPLAWLPRAVDRIPAIG
jgi:hypothetical protein